jgi:GNAT superfamily N-acetyltransferase
LEAEVDQYTAELAEQKDERGRRLVVRNGHHRPRTVTTAAGAVEVASFAVTPDGITERLGFLSECELVIDRIGIEGSCPNAVFAPGRPLGHQQLTGHRAPLCCLVLISRGSPLPAGREHGCPGLPGKRRRPDRYADYPAPMAAPRELQSIRDVRSAANGDALLLWAAADLMHGRRVFSLGEATAVAAPTLSCCDRLAVTGPADDAAALVRAVLPQVGPTFRPIGDEDLIRSLVSCVPQLEFVDAFGWMQTKVSTGRCGGATGLTASDQAEIAKLLDEAFPESYARPGRPGARRWAGARDVSGTLLACAADAWSAPHVGFLAGVSTAEQARGRGMGTAVCSLVLDGLVADHGVAALIVDSWNTAAIRLYRSLGLSWRSLAAARFTDR